MTEREKKRTTHSSYRSFSYSFQSGGSDIPLGRVYVEDPDDWDVGDKSFAWLTAPQPPFILNSNTGNIFVSSQVREGR